MKKNKLTLKEWLKGKHEPQQSPAHSPDALFINDVPGDIYNVTGDPDTIDEITADKWMIDVLDDGTAITWCMEK